MPDHPSIIRPDQCGRLRMRRPASRMDDLWRCLRFSGTGDVRQYHSHPGELISMTLYRATMVKNPQSHLPRVASGTPLLIGRPANNERHPVDGRPCQGLSFFDR